MIIEKDRVVSIDYVLAADDGEILASTEGGEPLLYLHGHENIIPGLERALEGKEPGAHLKVTVEAKDGYGERDEKLIITLPRERFEGVDAI